MDAIDHDCALHSGVFSKEKYRFSLYTVHIDQVAIFSRMLSCVRSRSCSPSHLTPTSSPATESIVLSTVLFAPAPTSLRRSYPMHSAFTSDPAPACPRAIAISLTTASVRGKRCCREGVHMHTWACVFPSSSTYSLSFLLHTFSSLLLIFADCGNDYDYDNNTNQLNKLR